MHTILLIDDEKDIRGLLKDILEDEGFHVLEAEHSMQAELLVQQNKEAIDLVILDIWLENSEKDGLELLKDLRKDKFDKPVIMISGHGSIDTAVKSIRYGAYDFIEKPFKTERLLLTINNAIEKTKLLNENQTLKSESHNAFYETSLVGSSKSIEHLRRFVENVANSDSRVFISGEVGTGKESLAKKIHNASTHRRTKLFQKVDCNALTIKNIDEQILSKLFDKNCATLFLDEVCNLKKEIQKTLSKALQKTEEDTARIISASSKDIKLLLEQDAFSQNLYDRLAVDMIMIPNLKLRKEDIPFLIDELIEEICLREKRKPIKFDKDVQALFQNYDWPGNISELKNTIEWIILLSKKNNVDTVSIKNINTNIFSSILDSSEHGKEKTQSNVYLFEQSIKQYPLKEAREVFEKFYLQEQMQRFDGNISKTAHFIGMERTALHRKLKSLGLSSKSKKVANDG